MIFLRFYLLAAGTLYLTSAVAAQSPAPSTQEERVNAMYEKRISQLHKDKNQRPATSTAPAPVDPEFLRYSQAVQAKVKGNWKPPQSSTALKSSVLVSLKADGGISEAVIENSSGNIQFDAQVLEAVKGAAPLPAPPRQHYESFKQIRLWFDNQS